MSTEEKLLTKSTKINLGAGNKAKSGFINIDKLALPGIDLVLDLELEKFPFPDESIDYVFSEHFLEHINNFSFIINEIYRILKKNGKFEFIVPAWSSSGAFQDPTHVRFFHPAIINYVTDKSTVNYFPNIHFKAISVAKTRTDYYRRLYRLLTPLIRIFGKKRFDRYVDFLFLNMYSEIKIKLKKIQ